MLLFKGDKDGNTGQHDNTDHVTANPNPVAS